MRRHAAELGGPQHERFVEQPALLEIGQQRGRRLVEDRAVPIVVGLQRFVGIPVQQPVDARRPRRTVKIHVSHALLQQPPREQAISRVGRLERIRVVGAVEPSRSTADSAGEVGNLRRGKLHPGRQLDRH